MADTVGTDRPSDAASPDAASLALTDGRPHPLLNLASLCVLVAGLVAFVLGMLLRYDSGTGKAVAIAAAAIGLVTLLVGLFGQMMSATRIERILLVTGMTAGFVGLALGLAHGGFS
jgi:hypothetical protein